MKKILFIFALFASLVTAAQDIPPGYTNINNRYQWTAGLFRALGVPSGDSAQFQTGQAQRQGALYYDSTDNNTPKGLYQWNGSIWQIVGTPGTTVLPDDVVSGRSVTWEGGFRFHVQEGIVRIDNQLYLLDSFTHTLDSNDVTYDRFDRIYDDITGSHVLEGVAADPAAIPQLQGGQIGLTTILLENGGTNPSVSSLIVYQENDATITPSGTTAVGNSTANPFVGTYNIRITTINNGDFVDIIKSSGTWDISDVTSLTLHIRNRAQVPQLANLRVSLWNGASTGSQVSGEVILNYNKNNTTTYQAIAIPMAAFGTITNTNIDRIRLRFTSNNNNNFTGYDLDNIEFQAGVPQPGNGSTGQFTLTLPSFLTITPSSTIITNNTSYTISANGSSSQYVRGDGSLATFSAVTTVGSFGSQASNSNGAVISGSSIYFQPVTASNPGMVTSAMKASWDSIYTAENLSSVGDSIMTQVAVDRLGFKSIHLTNQWGVTDSTIRIDTTGGVAGTGFFGTDVATAITEHDAAGYAFIVDNLTEYTLNSGSGDETEMFKISNQHIRLETQAFGFFGILDVAPGQIVLQNDLGNYQIVSLLDSANATNKMVVWDSVTNKLFARPIPDGGGGGDNIYNTDGALTDSRTVDLDDNTLQFADGATPYLTIDAGVGVGIGTATPTVLFQVQSGGVDLLSIDPTAGAEASQLLAFNTTGDDNFALFGASTTNTGTLTRIQGAFNGAVKESKIDLVTNSTDATIEYSADTHTFTSTGVFSVTNGANNFLSIDPTAGSEVVRLLATNTTGDNNVVGLIGSASNTDAVFNLVADFNDGVKAAQVLGSADASSSSIAYTADTHTFTGNILTATDNTYDIGSSSESFKDGYFRSLKLDGSTSGNSTLFSESTGITLESTNATGTGAVATVMFSRATSDVTLSNVNTVQAVFGSSGDVWTLQGNTTYWIEGFYSFTHGATSHSVGMSFELGGGASVTSISYTTNTWVTALGTATATQNTNAIQVATNTNVNSAGANATEQIWFSGFISMNAGGTVTPSITFSAAPGGSPVTEQGSYIKFTPVANGTATVLGAVN